MRGCDLHRESDYRRRLRIITFLVFLATSAAFLWLPGDVARQVLTMQFGLQGPTKTLPEITLLHGRDPYEDVQQENRYAAMRAFDLEDIEDIGPAEGPQRRREEPRKETVVENLDAFEEPYARHYPAHTEVSYSEDYVILHMVKPVYPSDELKHGIEGDVTVEILVNDRGSVDAAWVLLATGSRNFEQATLDAVHQFRFKPPIVEGTPSSMWIRFEIRFRIMG